LSGWYNAPIAAWEILAITDKALSIDPNLAEAHAARGVALANSGQRAEAAAAFERALELDPNSFDANLSFARFCVTDGELERAVQLYTKALEIQPEDSQPPLLMQTVLRTLGRIEEAEKYARLGVKRAEETLRLYPESARPAQGAACALAALGEKEAAIAMMERGLAIDPDDNNARYNAACTYALLGEIDRAMDVMEVWASNAGREQLNWFKHDSDLDPIRHHPRYQALLKVAG